MKAVHVVLGLGYGDEGKGLITARNLLNGGNFVIRFSGGHQVGHTIAQAGIKHTYSNFPSGFGSSLFRSKVFFWSKNCTVCPSTLFIESKALISKCGINNSHFKNSFNLSPESPVTTPYDIAANQVEHATNGNISTIGVGYGTTMKRFLESPHKLKVTDLLAPRRILEAKLEGIKDYYSFIAFDEVNIENMLEGFWKGVDWIKNFGKFGNLMNYTDDAIFVFEGNQGFLLDQERGIFPHVTRGYTTGRQAYEILRSDKRHHDLNEVTLDLVTRAYSTRHGAGSYPNEEGYIKLYSVIGNRPEEINVTNPFQGDFRMGTLYYNELFYAIDSLILEAKEYNFLDLTINIHVTCLDQTNDKVLVNNEFISFKTFSDAIRNRYEISHKYTAVKVIGHYGQEIQYSKTAVSESSN